MYCEIIEVSEEICFKSLFKTWEFHILEWFTGYFDKTHTIEKKYNGGWLASELYSETITIIGNSQMIKIYYEAVYNGHMGDWEEYLLLEFQGLINVRFSMNNNTFPFHLTIAYEE